MMNALKKAITFFLLIGVMSVANGVLAADSATYTYDNQGRVLTITYKTGVATVSTITYVYDSAGNRVSEVVTCSGSC